MAFESLTQLSALSTLPIWAILVITIWTLIWKGLALWKSAKRNSIVWFVVLLVVNTLGILEILYIFIFSDLKTKKKNANKIQKRTKSKTSRKSRS